MHFTTRLTVQLNLNKVLGLRIYVAGIRMGEGEGRGCLHLAWELSQRRSGNSHIKHKEILPSRPPQPFIFSAR